MQQLSWLSVVVYLIVLLSRAESGLEIIPRALLIKNDANGIERQSQITQVIFRCLQVIPDTPPHRPPNEVVWMKDGHVIKTVNTRKYRHYRLKKRLLIRNPNELDSGVYECALAVNSTEKGKAELWIAPRVLSAPTRQNIEVNQDSRIDCLVTGGARTVDWWRNRILIASSDVIESDSRYTVISNGSLLIRSVSRSDRGRYSCIVRNKAGEQNEDIIVKTVNVGSQTIPSPGVGGEEESISSSVSSEVTHSSTSSEEPLIDTLHTSCVEYGDISFGTIPPLPTLPSDQLTLSFNKVPPKCVQTTVSYTIVLHCSAQGHLSPTITWKHNGIDIEITNQVSENRADNHFVQLADGSLMISRAQQHDKGSYKCIASNSVTSISTEVYLKVIGEAEICGNKGGFLDSQEKGSRQKRIVNGFSASGIDEWPWQVLLEYRNDVTSPSDIPLFCGGALIQPNWVLTAAHCLSYHGTSRSASNLIVRVGVHNRTSDSEVHQQSLKVRRYIIHPSYNMYSRSFSENDVALLELEHPVRLSQHASLICLPPHEEPATGTLCTVTGWGKLLHGVNEYPEVLHKGHVPLVSFEDCSRRESYRLHVTRNMLCAGWKDGGADACQNDSGGPLVCEIPNSEGKWGLYGIVNYGEGCGAPNKFGVYARVTRYLQWVTDTMTT